MVIAGAVRLKNGEGAQGSEWRSEGWFVWGWWRVWGIWDQWR